MKVTRYEDRESWLLSRVGKITGTRVKDIIVKRGTEKKIGFYELIAERIALPADGENPMDRGTRLEEEAIKKFEEQTGKKVNTDLVIWQREDNENIAISPDGTIEEENAAVEVKCLSSARHVEAIVTKQVPKELRDQVIQYFCVNDDLQTVYSVFYDPRMSVKDFFVIETKREHVQEEVEAYLSFEKDTLEEVNRIVNEWTF